MRKILYLFISLSIFIALFIFSQSGARETQAVANSSIADQQIDPEKEKFEPARKMLLEAGVAFDPDILLSPDWRVKLGATFTRSYEMHTSLRVSERLQGAQIADTVVLPEKVELTGDLIIIANTLVYEGNNTVIEGVGKNVYVFPIKDEISLGKTFESELRQQGFSANSIPEKGQRVEQTFIFKDRVKGFITIRVNGQGPEEWRKTLENGFEETPNIQNLSPEVTCPQGTKICNGGPGATGGIGNPGVASGNFPESPSNGRPAICSRRNPELADGGDGDPGENFSLLGQTTPAEANRVLKAAAVAMWFMTSLQSHKSCIILNHAGGEVVKVVREEPEHRVTMPKAEVRGLMGWIALVIKEDLAMVETEIEADVEEKAE